MSVLTVNHLKKVYTTRFGTNTVTALKNVSFSVEKGEFIAIMGESGSGKTTLLNILASLDKPTAGSVLLNGVETTKIKDKEISKFRRDHLGFVFQDFNLLDTFNLKDNIFLPLVLQGKSVKEMEEKLKSLAQLIGISDLLHKYPYEVSGGQKQRCAIARALITNPDIILADEPTGALDSRSSETILNIFETVAQKSQTVLMVTHSSRAAAHASRVLFIKDGEVYHELYRASQSEDQFYETIQSTLMLMERSHDFHA